MTETEAKEFYTLPLPERFHRFMVSEFFSEEDYQKAMKQNDYDYLPILYKIKQEMPIDFFAYFSDLLMEEEYDNYQQLFITSFK